ncbi:helix-turn-helix domain-containing protein [Streptomyces hundungensis]|uniref:helix-turn-helix transcriptional regulator n=1 Tax=Streptomyces hundungensis TaxID=1077946 RepID=UPI003F541C6C
MRRADVALLRGELEKARTSLDDAHAAFGKYDPMAQHAIPLARIGLGIAAAQGRIDEARAELARAVEPGFPPGTQRYGWPLLAAAAAMEADVRGLPSAQPGRAAALDLIRTAAKRLPTGVPWCEAFALVVAAELERAEDRDTAARWEAATQALRPAQRPYDLALACHRWAAALLAEGGDRETVATLLRQAHAESERLGARPLSEQLELLARRARLSLTAPDPVGSDDPTEPAEALGLTSREQDVLRLVAAGHSNRQIAEELYISPKTASVHVSNILAKLGVSGRGEAAALAHRLNLFSGQPARS